MRNLKEAAADYLATLDAQRRSRAKWAEVVAAWPMDINQRNAVHSRFASEVAYHESCLFAAEADLREAVRGQ